jgi:hypothetical protein
VVTLPGTELLPLLTKVLNVSYPELKYIVHSVFVLGGDSDLSEREETIIEGT